MVRVEPGEILTTRALNRALLARQHLIERVDWPAERMIAHLVGLQAQAPNPPYFGLWSRLRSFRTDDLSRLIEERRAVRVALMRSTIHLVTADDCLALRPLLASVHQRAFTNTYGRFLTGIDHAEVAAAGRALVEEQPRSFNELEALLGARWGDRDRRALAQAVRTYVPLIQVPPRGLWGQSGQASHTSAERWLGRSLSERPEIEALVRRYLDAFGPASVQDIQAWSGLTGLRAVVARLRPELVAFRDERGRELVDLPDAPRPDADTPIPPRLVAEFDNLLLSHVDRTRIISDEDRARVFTVNGIIKGTVLIDGFVGGIWKLHRERASVTLDIELFRPIEEPDRAYLDAEGARLLEFAGGEHRARSVRFNS
ncbi:MAG: AlkZ family DNA glycosylase [Thermomicrobiales bacterium]|nr:AlkZ family DNA glycosylase [Thermomicrobiales bacterium]